PYPAFRERESVGEWNPPAEDGSRPGIYFLSTYDPGHKARADLEALTFHETIPGHHLQGSIALERGQAIPAIARYFWSPGFGEGWAEYAEQLADEMGLYSSDTARLGALADITRSAGSRFGGCARRRRAPSVRASTSGRFTTACWRTGRCRCPSCGRTSSDGSPPRASPDRRLVGGRRARDGAGSTRAGPEAGRRP